MQYRLFSSFHFSPKESRNGKSAVQSPLHLSRSLALRTEGSYGSGILGALFLDGFLQDHILLLIYWNCPKYLKAAALVINFFVTDPIPYIDEFIMVARLLASDR